MKRLLSLVVACVVLSYTPGAAQHEQFHRWFADSGRVACYSWRSPATASARFNRDQYFADGALHAWVYGFVVGAAYSSGERLPRVDAIGVSDWMDKFCRERPMARIADAAAALVDHLATRR